MARPESIKDGSVLLSGIEIIDILRIVSSGHSKVLGDANGES